jgi:DNA-binding LacI/PurR family transcriptional regulator
MPIYEHCFGEQPLIELMATMLQDQPTAMIICGESISNEAVYALNLLQVKVPTDLSIISFEKRDSSRWFSPPHTTVVQDAREMVSETMVLVRDIIKKCPKENYSKQLPCKLKIRNSVRRLCG